MQARIHTLFLGARLFSSTLLASLALAGCGREEATAPAQAHVSSYDLSFITNLYNVVEFDRQVIGQELARTPDPRVAALARDLLREANDMDAKVRPIAEREGIVPPDTVSFRQRADLQTRIASVMGTGTYDFDEEFLTDEIDSHVEALQRVKDMAAEPAGNPELKALSEQAAGLLQTNLDRLRALQAEKQSQNG
jgi:predicted outer membrane protein